VLDEESLGIDITTTTTTRTTTKTWKEKRWYHDMGWKVI
jgi:hypothetical protein